MNSQFERGNRVNTYARNLTFGDKMFGTKELVDRQASVIKKTYAYLSLSVVAAIAGGYVGVSTPAVVNLFSGFMGWILAIVLLNVMPMVSWRVWSWLLFSIWRASSRRMLSGRRWRSPRSFSPR